MAKRPVFVPCDEKPYYREAMVPFKYNAGFAKCQKRKNIEAIHDGFRSMRPGAKLLEISTKSLQDEGAALSAFNLTKFVPSLGRKVPLECIYHAGKVFEDSSAHPEFMSMTPLEAKRAARRDEKIRAFTFEGQYFDAGARDAFYNYLYIGALLEDPEHAQKLLDFDGFTDIEFSQKSSIACQARAAAIYVSFIRRGRADELKDYIFKAAVGNIE